MKIGIYGYGNLGRAAEIVADGMRDASVVAVFTRREPDTVRTLRAPVYSRERAEEFREEIDCMLACGGSRDDLMQDTPKLSEMFNTVDSFDMHGRIDEHIAAVNEAAARGRKCAVISAGWDPGLLSVMRLYFASVMPYSKINTFWGRGISQGHSEAVRRIDGVKRAVQYTLPREGALFLALSGESLSDTERHRRVCYVVAEAGREEEIAEKIKTMPEYFAGYDTEVNFITEKEFVAEHCMMPHRGEVIAHGMSGVYGEHAQRCRLTLELDSNPEFTASVMLAYARACVRLACEGSFGARCVFDIPPSYLFAGGGNKLL